MAEVYHAPLKLNRTNRYPGYQFYARIRVDGMSETEAFHYVILSVYDWIRSKVPEEDQKAPELQVPVPEAYGDVSGESFASFHLNIGFALDITPLMDSGIWTLRIKDPDPGVDDRAPVAGRFFTTRVGIRLNEKGYTELGIRIDVTDPATVEKELDVIFRPSFVKTLALQPSVHFEQARDLLYGKAYQVNSEEDYKQLLYMLGNEENQLALVIFTHMRPGQKKPRKNMSMEELIKGDQIKSLLQFSGMTIPGLGKAFPGMSGDAASVAEIPKPPVLPYDADHFSRSAFAYAMTFVLGDSYTERFREKIKKDFSAGDILICGAKKFRGGVAVVGYPGDKDQDLKKAYDMALLAAQGYIKHKAPYDYDSVVFEAEARKLEQHARVMELVNSSSMEDKDKIAQMQYEMQLLFDVIDDKDKDLEDLRSQKEDEFRRGEDFGKEGMAALEEENARLKKSLGEKQDQIDAMKNSFEQAGLLGEALEKMRTIDTLPESNEDVVNFFRSAYQDRIDFTDRGLSSASKCELRTANLWGILYLVAHKLVDVFREKTVNLTEEEVMHATGFEMSFHEGSMTREQKDMMRLREDVYQGKTISVEPHLKLKTGKGEPVNQRLHFWFDPDMKRIVIGHLGNHLDSASSRYVK